ncbi:MAG: response regulator [Verrucomicrobiaceae bacterium]|nr:response regulator [Verrucomicrobiaceae bacterium]
MPSPDLSRTILIVEDNNIIRDQIVAILEMSGYTAMAAANGSDGLRLACQSRPALIISDVMMPELNGLDMLRDIRQNPELDHTPIVLLSGLIATEDIRKGLELGASDYLIKPFRITDLLQVVSRHLQFSH